jgi:hypothetical protein
VTLEAVLESVALGPAELEVGERAACAREDAQACWKRAMGG